MNREQYLRELEARLSNRMAPDELRNVMQYYEEYFNEMGPEGEEKAIADLGGPAELSRRILGEPPTAPEPPPVSAAVDVVETPWEQPRRRLGTGWIVLLCILAAPIVIPLAVGLLGLFLGLAIGILALFAGLCIGGLAATAYGIFSVVTGFASLFTHGMATTMFFVGGGMLTSGVGILLVAGGAALTGLSFRGLWALLRLIFRGRRARA